MKRHLAPDPPGCPRNESTFKPHSTILVNGDSICRQNEGLAREQARSGASHGVTTSQGRREVRREKGGRVRAREGGRAIKGRTSQHTMPKTLANSSQLLVH